MVLRPMSMRQTASVALVVLAALMTGVGARGASVTASAQVVRGVVPEATERFEVATVKPNKEPVPGLVPRGAFVVQPGHFRVTQATLEELITYAYELYAFEILGGPSWATSDRFDIVATMEPSASGPATPGPRRAACCVRFLPIASSSSRARNAARCRCIR